MNRTIVAISMVVLFFAGTGLGFANRVEGNPNGRYKILIAMESTPYKNQLVNALVSKLSDGNVSIRIIDHQRGELNGVNPRDFNAVVITNSGVQAMVRPAVMTWLTSVQAQDDNVILHTTQINNWTPPVEVDSVTSASRRNNIAQVTDDIVQRIRSFF